MTIAFALGNGVSRKDIDLNVLAQVGRVYGCNRLYQDFTPTALVATDRLISTEIQESGWSGKHRFHTRRPIPGLGAQPVPKQYYGSSSGPICVALSCLDGNQKVFLLGFDLGPTEAGKFNNVYADTLYYKKSTDSPTFTGNWIKQIVQVTTDFKVVEFIRVCGPTTARIPEFEMLPNLKNMQMPQFLEWLNNEKDF